MMKSAELKAYRIERLDFVNKIPQNTKMQLENKISYNVGYSPNNTCKGEFKAEISDKQSPENFHLTIVMTGIFVTQPDAEKEKLHLETYDLLYPFVKSAVAMFTTQAGIPPVMLPYADISKQNIYRFNMPGNAGGTENGNE